MNSMLKFFRNSIKAKLVSLMLLMAIIPMVVASLIYLNIARNTITEQNFDQLTTTLQLRKEILVDNLERNIKLLQVAAANRETQDAYLDLKTLLTDKR